MDNGEPGAGVAGVGARELVRRVEELVLEAELDERLAAAGVHRLTDGGSDATSACMPAASAPAGGQRQPHSDDRRRDRGDAGRGAGAVRLNHVHIRRRQPGLGKSRLEMYEQEASFEIAIFNWSRVFFIFVY